MLGGDDGDDLRVVSVDIVPMTRACALCCPWLFDNPKHTEETGPVRPSDDSENLCTCQRLSNKPEATDLLASVAPDMHEGHPA